MSFINDKTKEINCKIIYYGPPWCGKSTTLTHIYDQVQRSSKKEGLSLSRGDDRTLFFDFVPLHLGRVRGYTIRMHLYTFPGDAGYQQSRALISKGVDGVVFVADSRLQMMEANLQSLAGLKEILKSEGHEWGKIPLVYQYNKRDLPGAVPKEEIGPYLNKEGAKEFETVATTGEGVFDAFREICAAVLRSLKSQAMEED